MLSWNWKNRAFNIIMIMVLKNHDILSFYLIILPLTDIEYKAFVDQLTRPNSRKACKALNTGAEYGWDLAVIPTAYHQEQVWAYIFRSKTFKSFTWIELHSHALKQTQTRQEINRVSSPGCCCAAGSRSHRGVWWHQELCLDRPTVSEGTVPIALSLVLSTCSYYSSQSTFLSIVYM